MKYQFTNNAYSYLVAGITPDNTALLLSAGTGPRFPANLTNDTPAQVTVTSVDGTSEVMQAWQRSGDRLEVLRGQEGSSVGTFPEGSLVELRLTAAVLNSFMTSGGGDMHGGLNMNGNSIVSANLYGAPFIDYVKTNGVYPPDGNFTGALEVLNGAVHPRINGASILTTFLLQSAIFPWWGRIDQLPPWLKVCDGSNGTPDLRGRFLLAANGDGELGGWGGQFHGTTYFIQAHNHGGGTMDATLSGANLPPLSGSAASLKVTNENILIQALGASDPSQRSVAFVKTVSMTGGNVNYSGGANHAHGIYPDGGHDHGFDAVPPYFRLHFVMFRSLNIN